MPDEDEIQRQVDALVRQKDLAEKFRVLTTPVASGELLDRMPSSAIRFFKQLAESHDKAGERLDPTGAKREAWRRVHGRTPTTDELTTFRSLFGASPVPEQDPAIPATSSAQDEPEPDRHDAFVAEGNDDNHHGTRARVHLFLQRCNEICSDRIIKSHIWKSAGHTTARQFEFFQAGDGRATDADRKNFNRILEMEPAEFIELLRTKKILSV